MGHEMSGTYNASVIWLSLKMLIIVTLILPEMKCVDFEQSVTLV
jgi:hypothetical protein